MPVFMTPSEVAERLGAMYTESSVRRIARQFQCFTRGPRKMMMFTEDDYQQLVDTIKNPPRPHQDPDAEDFDPFAPTPRMPRLGGDPFA